MKYLYIIILSIVIISCSKSDNTPTQSENTTLLKKMISGNQVINLSYNGFKLKELTFDGFSGKEIYTYDGDLITEIKYVIPATNKIEYTESYTYQNNILKTFINNTERNSNKTIYTYTNNQDGTVSYIKKDIDKITLVETLRGNGTLTFLSGVVIKDELFDVNYPNNSNVLSAGSIYEYDNKNSFLKNIIGLNKIYGDKSTYGIFNLLKNYQFTKSLQNGVITSGNNNPETRTYTYNSNNFPIESKFYEVDGSLKGTTQYFYE